MDINNAYRFTLRKHNDTKAIRRSSGEPYIVHPEAVAEFAIFYGGDEVEIKAALAHDLLEGAGVLPQDLEEKFGKEVLEVVSELTNDKER